MDQKVFVLATNTEYTLLVLAIDKDDAIEKAVNYTMYQYGSRVIGSEPSDWVAYDAVDYIRPNDVIEVGDLF